VIQKIKDILNTQKLIYVVVRMVIILAAFKKRKMARSKKKVDESLLSF